MVGMALANNWQEGLAHLVSFCNLVTPEANAANTKTALIMTMIGLLAIKRPSLSNILSNEPLIACATRLMQPALGPVSILARLQFYYQPELSRSARFQHVDYVMLGVFLDP